MQHSEVAFKASDFFILHIVFAAAQHMLKFTCSTDAVWLHTFLTEQQ
jgi:hypothetical protein